MELQEYHVKRIFKKAGLPVLNGHVAYTPKEVKEIATKLKKGPFTVKAQIFGYNPCYGVVLPLGYKTNGCFCVATPKEAEEAASQLLMKQPDWLAELGPLVDIQKVYVEQAAQDFVVVGRLIFRVNFEKQCKVLRVEPEGASPVEFSFDSEISLEQLEKAAKKLCAKLPIEPKDMLTLFEKAHQLFEFYGAVALELSPIILEKGTHLKVVDGRLVFDPNNVSRFPELLPLIESRIGKERERLARKNGFRYVGLKGNIACITNGIGLGWATIDLVQRKGGRVAALLDVGTEPSKDVIVKALRLVLSEPNVDAILVNIFGCITRCDLIAEGLISASPEMVIGLPLVVRMDGTNADIGQRLLFESKLPFIVQTKMDEAVRAVIKKVKEKN